MFWLLIPSASPSPFCGRGSTHFFSSAAGFQNIWCQESAVVVDLQNIFKIFDAKNQKHFFNIFDSVEAKYHQIQKISKDVKCQLFTDGGRWVSSRPSFFIAPQCYLDICQHNALYFGDLGCTDYLCHIYICEENILWSSWYSSPGLRLFKRLCDYHK